MAERLGVGINPSSIQGFEFGSFPPDLVAYILRIYRDTRSYLRTSMQDGVAGSPASVQRIVGEAVNRGILDSSITHHSRPRAPREKIMELINNYPEATRVEIARKAGVSTATLFRALRGE